jgi:ABC-type dipeptide/oligopeptide/nickel transport system permease subunit
MALVGTTFLGIVTGLISGYFGGICDAAFNMMAEIRQSMPMMLIIIVFLAVFGPSILSMGIILAISGWVMIYRTVRARTIMEKKSDYVTAARANGAGNFRIIFKYIMPNVLPSVIVLSMLTISNIILQEASLSYLGIGVTRPHPSWGRMISDGQEYFANGVWWVSSLPAMCIALLVLGVNIMGDGLRQMWKME